MYTDAQPLDSLEEIQDSQQFQQELLQNSQQEYHTPQHNKNGKRTSDVILEAQNKKKHFDLKEKVSLHDPDELTCIRDYLDFSETDPLVYEYLQKLFCSPYLPTIPDTDLISQWLDNNSKCGLTQVTKVECIHDFVFYFQSRYFAQNVQGAVNNSVALFNPKVNFNVPQFQLLPLKTLNNLGKLKEQFALSYQSETLIGSQFAIELRLLRIIDRITTEINRLISDEEDRKSTFLYFFATLYTKARTEFFKNFNVKKIDWSNRISKSIVTLPKWRKENCEPPKSSINKYVAKSCEIMLRTNCVISAETAKTEFDSWLKSNNHNVPPQTVGPRNFKQASRKFNKHYSNNGPPQVINGGTLNNNNFNNNNHQNNVPIRNQNRYYDTNFRQNNQRNLNRQSTSYNQNTSRNNPRNLDRQSTSANPNTNPNTSRNFNFNFKNANPVESQVVSKPNNTMSKTEAAANIF